MDTPKNWRKILFFQSRDGKTGFFILGNYLQKTLAVTTLFVLVLTFTDCRSRMSEPATGPRVINDDLGNKVRLPLKVTRAVSLAPNLTEIVFAVGAGDRLVGVTTFCDYPEKAKSVAKVGDTLQPNIEAIIALRPQIVLVSTASQLESFSRVLKEQGIEVFVTNPTTLEGVYSGIRNVARIFGESENGKLLEKEMRNRVRDAAESINSGGNPSSVFVQIDPGLYTVGKNSFISDALSRLNIVSVTSDIDEPYPKISKEHARGLKPDFILISKSPGNESPNDVFDSSAAVREGRVYEIDADILSRPGPRIVDALEQIAGLEAKRGRRK